MDCLILGYVLLNKRQYVIRYGAPGPETLLKVMRYFIQVIYDR